VAQFSLCHETRRAKCQYREHKKVKAPVTCIAVVFSGNILILLSINSVLNLFVNQNQSDGLHCHSYALLQRLKTNKFSYEVITHGK
jgi:hypothetical protein